MVKYLTLFIFIAVLFCGFIWVRHQCPPVNFLFFFYSKISINKYVSAGYDIFTVSARILSFHTSCCKCTLIFIYKKYKISSISTHYLQNFFLLVMTHVILTTLFFGNIFITFFFNSIKGKIFY